MTLERLFFFFFLLTCEISATLIGAARNLRATCLLSTTTSFSSASFLYIHGPKGVKHTKVEVKKKRAELT
jgi:hypothetical protein